VKFYKILRDYSLKIIDKDMKMRFDKVFSHIIKNDQISSGTKNILGDNDITNDEMKLITLDQTYLKKMDDIPNI